MQQIEFISNSNTKELILPKLILESFLDLIGFEILESELGGDIRLKEEQELMIEYIQNNSKKVDIPEINVNNKVIFVDNKLDYNKINMYNSYILCLCNQASLIETSNSYNVIKYDDLDLNPEKQLEFLKSVIETFNNNGIFDDKYLEEYLYIAELFCKYDYFINLTQIKNTPVRKMGEFDSNWIVEHFKCLKKMINQIKKDNDKITGDIISFCLGKIMFEVNSFTERSKCKRVFDPKNIIDILKPLSEKESEISDSSKCVLSNLYLLDGDFVDAYNCVKNIKNSVTAYKLMAKSKKVMFGKFDVVNYTRYFQRKYYNEISFYENSVLFSFFKYASPDNYEVVAKIRTMLPKLLEYKIKYNTISPLELIYFLNYMSSDYMKQYQKDYSLKCDQVILKRIMDEYETFLKNAIMVYQNINDNKYINTLMGKTDTEKDKYKVFLINELNGKFNGVCDVLIAYYRDFCRNYEEANKVYSKIRHKEL